MPQFSDPSLPPPNPVEFTNQQEITDFSSPEVQRDIAEHIRLAAAQGIVIPPEAFARPAAAPSAPSKVSPSGLAAATRSALNVNLGALSQKLGPFGPLIAVAAGILGTFGALSAMHRIKPASTTSSDRSRRHSRGRYR